jgi:hypothetical protein
MDEPDEEQRKALDASPFRAQCGEHLLREKASDLEEESREALVVMRSWVPPDIG